MAHHLHIRPWESRDLLTVQEFLLLADWVENHNTSQDESAGG